MPRYRPLSAVNKEIRLVIIEPDNSPLSPLKCSLVHVCLSRNPEYFALSYCWGDESDRTNIEVDGEKVSVTKNLCLALEDLRHQGMLVVWADALCINQDDLEERGQQVLRMDAIYRRALKTVSWLGPRSPWSSPNDVSPAALAFSLVEALQEFKETHSEAANVWQRKAVGKPKAAARFTPSGWPALRDLLSSDYWSRVWIIQEVAVASHVDIVWGRYTFAFEHLLGAITACELLQNDMPQAASIVELRECRRIQDLAKFREDEKSWNKPDLLLALLRSSDSKTTDPRDKVFGILNLTSNGANLVPEPDYEWDLATLNREICRRFMAATSSLDLVVMARAQPGPWAVDFFAPGSWLTDHAWRYLSQKSTIVRERPYARMREYVGFGSWVPIGLERSKYGVWGATQRSQGFFPLVDGEGRLLAQGKCIDRIKDCSATLGEVKSDAEYCRQAPPISLTNIPCTWNPDATVLKPLAWLMYDLGMFAEGSDFCPETIDAQHLHHLLRPPARYDAVRTQEPELVQWLLHPDNLKFKIKGKPTLEWLAGDRGVFRRSTFTNIKPGKITPRFLTTLRMDMRLVVTNEGHLGWASRSAEPGDLLFLLKGCTVPAILRKTPDKQFEYSLKGYGIVYGYMDGQGMRGRDYDWMDLVLK